MNVMGSLGGVSGSAAPAFEPVRELFARNVSALGAGGAALAVYVDAEPVVDLWAGWQRPGEPWQHDTRAVLFSATKGVVATAAMLLADRGLLDVDARLTRYWPEFGTNGKGGITVRQVLTHTCGVLSFPGAAELLRPDGAGWDDADAIATGLAAATPTWAPGTRHGYHALTYGWLVGEVVRRITGMPIGEFIRREIASPLDLDLDLGTPIADQHRVAAVRAADETLPADVAAVQLAAQAAMRDPATLVGQAYLGDGTRTPMDDVTMMFSTPRVLAAEIPAGGATATARALARLYALLAAGGALDGVRLVAEQTVRRWSSPLVHDVDALTAELPLPISAQPYARHRVTRTLGYAVNPALPGEPPRFGPSAAAYGAEGLGGQISFCDPDRRVAVGFVRSELSALPRLSTRLLAAVYDCLDAGRAHAGRRPGAATGRGLDASAAASPLHR